MAETAQVLRTGQTGRQPYHTLKAERQPSFAYHGKGYIQRPRAPCGRARMRAMVTLREVAGPLAVYGQVLDGHQSSESQAHRRNLVYARHGQ